MARKTKQRTHITGEQAKPTAAAPLTDEQLNAVAGGDQSQSEADDGTRSDDGSERNKVHPVVTAGWDILKQGPFTG